VDPPNRIKPMTSMGVREGVKLSRFIRKQFRNRTLLFLTLVLAIGLAAIAPYVQRAQRLASACYILGEVAAPGRMETLGRGLTVRGAIQAAGGLRSSDGQTTIRLVRPASVGVPEQVFSIDLNDLSTDYAIKPGDRLIVYKPNGS
jgi:protein involved in polysaccharide export with SLBB domain